MGVLGAGVKRVVVVVVVEWVEDLRWKFFQREIITLVRRGPKPR